MNIYKIVLTGGPCAGKSDIIENLINYYSNSKNRIFKIPETASEVLGAGIKFIEIDNPIIFQNIIFERQLNKEQTLYEGMSYMPLANNNLVFLDRGLIDNKAYLNTQAEFDSILTKYSQKELEILDSYDLVIDLISLATTNPDLYLKLCGNNPERYEDLETAQIIDKKTTTAWVGHKNIRYVYPTETLEEKIKIVIGYINDMLVSNQKKYTQMYLIENPTDIIMSLNDENSKMIEVTDCYLRKKIVTETDDRTILRKRVYKQCETNQRIVLDSNGSKIIEQVIGGDYWDSFTTDDSLDKIVKKVEYSTDIFGSPCKINCYDDFTTLEIPITNGAEYQNILTNFNVIEKIDNFEEFLDEKNKDIPKLKKYGTI